MRIFDVLGPLLGAIVGGVITLVVTRSLDTLRWRRERAEKLAELERKALSAALEWIEPMRSAFMQASFLATAAANGEIPEDRVTADWPDLLTILKHRDLDGSLRAVLPDEIYARGTRIVADLDSLKYDVLRHTAGVESIMPGTDESNQVVNAVGRLGRAIEELENGLRSQFRGTYR